MIQRPITSQTLKIGSNDLSSSSEIMKDCQMLLKQLFEMRLIDKIARPIDIRQKRIIVNKFEEKLLQLNAKMRQVKAEDDKEHEGYLNRVKSHKSTRSKTLDYRKQAKMLYAQYNDVLREGSFKHYPRVAKLYNLQQLQVLNVSYWLVEGEVRHSKKRCC